MDSQTFRWDGGIRSQCLWRWDCELSHPTALDMVELCVFPRRKIRRLLISLILTRNEYQEAPDELALYSHKRCADDMKALATHLGESRIILGGHDW